eukprot:Seg1722.8 transcript_id=Seg1722.8/GoldUCD/mRNA.D3Y31 product="Pleckstrin-like domain-containing family M member 2" protein_id=Seg1722.8/GoldUCD/D3Y31
MLSSAEFFKDETLQGISRSIQQLHQMQAEADSQKMENFGITKNNPHFRSLLHHLDMGLSLGLNDPQKGYWPLVKKLCHKTTIQMVQSHHEGTDIIKRGQLWLFLTFTESSILSYVKLIRSSEKNLKWFYKKYALLRDMERCLILEQLLVGLEMVTFVLDFNSPLVGFAREPLFKPTDFYAAKKAVHSSYIPQKSATHASTDPRQISSGTQTPPDVTIVDRQAEVRTRSTPDLICRATHGKERLPIRPLDDTDSDDLVTHLKPRKRGSSIKKRPEKVTARLDSEDSNSVSLSNELEEDNYIPEFQDSFPINLNKTMPKVTSDTDLADEHIYQDFLFAYDTKEQQQEADSKQTLSTGLSLDQEITDTSQKSDSDDPRLFSPEVPDVKSREDHVHFDEGGPTVVLASSVHSEDAYRITYVSDDDDDDADNVTHSDHMERAHQKMRSVSLDSFDRFCRSGSVNREDRDRLKSDATEHDYDDDDDAIRRQINVASPGIEAMEESTLSARGSLDMSIESDAIISSPVSKSLSKDGVNKVLNARFDTTTGILLPTLPRRPNFSDACGLYHNDGLDNNKLILLSLEIFEKSTEVFKKMFDVYVGYLFGIRKQAVLLITNMNIYLLSVHEKRDCGYAKELTLSIDSINRIQTGLNMQDVLITHDVGKLQLWTGNEVVTKNIILALSSSLKTEDARTVSVEQMKVEFHKHLDLHIKDWLMYVENVQEPEILHFALVDFHSISTQKPEQTVLKSGHLHRKLNYLGMVAYWESSIFGLRGSSLYEYSGKGNHELKQVFDLGKNCGGCVRMKASEKPHGIRLLGSDGSTPLLELAAESEDEANDWIVHICQVVADSKHGQDNRIAPFTDGVSPRALLLSSNKVYLLIQDSDTGRFALVDSCTIQDIPQICVDNQDRTYCALQIDDSIDSFFEHRKRTWILKFQSEYELGKFEQRIFAVWHTLYQVPLQFVLLADNDFKSTIRRHLSAGKQPTFASINDSNMSIADLKVNIFRSFNAWVMHSIIAPHGNKGLEVTNLVSMYCDGR